jgi:hypothetical protein
MAKKKVKNDRGDALNELKSLESKWLKDQRMDALQPIQVKVMAAKVAAFLDYVETSEMDVNLSVWPITGAEDLVKLDEVNFKKSVDSLQKAGVVNTSLKIRKAAEAAKTPVVEFVSEDGMLSYRCVKAGGITLSDRDEYIMEDQEVTYTEEQIGESANLQHAIANEWLVRVEMRQEA